MVSFAQVFKTAFPDYPNKKYFLKNKSSLAVIFKELYTLIS
jgi:hypothetical protein